MLSERIDRVRSAMAEQGINVCLLSVGPDLPWLTGYEAMPLERLTMLVVPAEADATLVVPALEVARVVPRDELFSIRPWGETDNPITIVSDLIGSSVNAAIGERTWARFLVELQQARPDLNFTTTASVIGPLRAVKDAAEVVALRTAAAAVDRIAAQLQAGEIPLIGRTEAEVSADIGRRILAEGHHRVNFAIVAAGENAASPHHEPGSRVIQPNEVVLCDFGGTMADADGVGYCSDITRCVVTGTPIARMTEVYGLLHTAEAAGLTAGGPGIPAEDVDTATRLIIEEGGFGEWFIHRTGHGIGVEEHEDPYIVLGNRSPLVAGNAYSVEPGIYLPGEFGFRLEDIVVVTSSGAESITNAERSLVPVEA
jgi:Xaa-Pro aminopeptidase